MRHTFPIALMVAVVAGVANGGAKVSGLDRMFDFKRPYLTDALVVQFIDSLGDDESFDDGELDSARKAWMAGQTPYGDASQLDPARAQTCQALAVRHHFRDCNQYLTVHDRMMGMTSKAMLKALRRVYPDRPDDGNDADRAVRQRHDKAFDEAVHHRHPRATRNQTPEALLSRWGPRYGLAVEGFCLPSARLHGEWLPSPESGGDLYVHECRNTSGAIDGRRVVWIPWTGDLRAMSIYVNGVEKQRQSDYPLPP
jgi:hypothetical protein